MYTFLWNMIAVGENTAYDGYDSCSLFFGGACCVIQIIHERLNQEYEGYNSMVVAPLLLLLLVLLHSW